MVSFQISSHYETLKILIWFQMSPIRILARISNINISFLKNHVEETLTYHLSVSNEHKSLGICHRTK